MTKIVSHAAWQSLAVLDAPPRRPPRRRTASTSRWWPTSRMLQEQTQQLAIAVAALTEALSQAVKAINARLDDANDDHAQGVRRSEAAHRQHGERRARDPRADRRHQRADRARCARSSRRCARSDARHAAGRRWRRRRRSSIPTAPVDPNAPPPAAAPARRLPRCRRPPGCRRRACSTRRAATTSPASTRCAITGFEAFLQGVPAIRVGRRRAVLHRRVVLRRRTAGEDAVAAYNAVIQNYPTSSIVPDDVLQARARAGAAGTDRRGARRRGRRWSRPIPDSDGARLAKQGLDRLSRASTRPRRLRR